MQDGKYNILVDIDGVVAKYNFKAMLMKHFGITVPDSWIYAYSIEDCLGLPSQDVWRMFVEEAKEPPAFIDGAQDALKKLIRKHTIYIYTNRVKIMGAAPLRQWLNDNHIPHDALYFNDLVHSDTYDYHIDDSPQKLMDTNGAVRHKLLFDQPYNRKCKNITGKLQRVADWAEVLEVIR